MSAVLIDTSDGIYCGTGYSFVSGDGLFFSDDGGKSWRQLGFTGKEVLALAFDSEWNLFAGTLEDGLFKTTNMGQSWTQYQNGIYRKEVYRLAINQQDDIFIGSEGGGSGWYFYGGGGLFRSTNGGELFEQVGLPISLVKNIVFSGDSLIITSTPSGVQKYNRSTKKWKNIGLHNVEAVSITPSGYLYAATREEGLYKSANLGNNWFLTNLTADTLMPVYNVLAVNDDTLFAATGYGMNLRRSTNGGQSWDILSLRTGEWERGLFYIDNNLWSTGISAGLVVLYRTDNYGNSFDSLYSEFSAFDSNNLISVTKNGFSFIASGGNYSHGIIRSIDNGLNWERVLSKKVVTVYGDSNGLVITGTLVESISDTNKIYLSNNYGSTWYDVAQPTKWGIYITDIKPDLTNKLFFGTSGEGLYEVDIITNVEEKSTSNFNFYLSQNYPNPFNPKTSIQYTVGSRQFVSLKVYDVLGREITILLNEYKQAGNYEIEFDASSLPSGIYFYQLNAGKFIQTKKMILLK